MDEDWEEEIRTGISTHKESYSPYVHQTDSRSATNFRGTRPTYNSMYSDNQRNWRDRTSNESGRRADQNSNRGPGRGRGFPQTREFPHTREFPQENGYTKDHGFIDSNIYTESHQMTVPNHALGRIIGKGGSRIRELEDSSECKINIDRSQTDSGPNITLSGPPEAIEKAREEIEAIVNSQPRQMSNSYRPLEYKPRVEEPVTRPLIDWSRVLLDKELYDQMKFKDLPPVEKNFYFEDPDVAAMYPEEVEEFRKLNNNIMVFNLHEKKEGAIPNPIATFEQAFLRHPLILEQIHKQDFKKPTPVQTQAWPILLKGLDLIGIAQVNVGYRLLIDSDRI